jgi:hypothetical protein
VDDPSKNRVLNACMSIQKGGRPVSNFEKRAFDPWTARPAASSNCRMAILNKLCQTDLDAPRSHVREDAWFMRGVRYKETMARLAALYCARRGQTTPSIHVCVPCMACATQRMLNYAGHPDLSAHSCTRTSLTF